MSVPGSAHGDPTSTSLRMCRVLYQRGATTIFLCEDMATQQHLAVKRSIRPTRPDDQVERQRVTLQRGEAQPPVVLMMSADSNDQELRVLQAFRASKPHPHIVNCLDFTTTDTESIVAMEYCTQGDLFSLLEKQPEHRIPEAQALRYFNQVVRGIQHLHSLGFAHRDISLENVLIDANGCVKICDFGLSADSSMLSHDCVGKLQYMAPEVVNEEPYDPIRADMWSLGIVLFVLLTGSPLFVLAEPTDPAWNALREVGIGGILVKWKMDGYASPTTIELLEKLLQTDPKLRPGCLNEILDYLL